MFLIEMFECRHNFSKRQAESELLPLLSKPINKHLSFSPLLTLCTNVADKRDSCRKGK